MEKHQTPAAISNKLLEAVLASSPKSEPTTPNLLKAVGEAQQLVDDFNAEQNAKRAAQAPLQPVRIQKADLDFIVQDILIFIIAFTVYLDV